MDPAEWDASLAQIVATTPHKLCDATDGNRCVSATDRWDPLAIHKFTIHGGTQWACDCEINVDSISVDE